MFDVAVVERDRAEVLRRALLARRTPAPSACRRCPRRAWRSRARAAPAPTSTRAPSASGRAALATLMNGITTSVASASRQSRTSRRTAVPMSSERALRERRHAVGDELVDRLDVVRHPADQDAGAVPLVEAERERLQVAEELLAAGRRGSARRPSRSCTSRRRSCPSSRARRRRTAPTTSESLKPVVAVDARRRARTSRGRAARARSPSRRGARRRRGTCGSGTASSAARGRRAAGASCSTTSPRPSLRAALPH